MVEILRLHVFLVGFSVVKIVEIGYDDRHGQSDRKHTGDCTQGANDLPPHSDGPRNKRRLEVALAKEEQESEAELATSYKLAALPPVAHTCPQFFLHATSQHGLLP